MIINDYLVTGMTCEHCARAVSNELSTVSDVTDVHVDLLAGRVTVTSGAALDRQVVAAAVEEAGYELADTGRA